MQTQVSAPKGFANDMADLVAIGSINCNERWQSRS
jgi:hypothetical protein